MTFLVGLKRNVAFLLNFCQATEVLVPALGLVIIFAEGRAPLGEKAEATSRRRMEGLGEGIECHT